MSRLLPQRGGTVSSIAHAQVVIKTAWYGARVLKTGSYWTPCGWEGNSKERSQAVKKNIVSTLLIKSLLVVGLHELQVSERPSGAQWRSSLWPTNNSIYSWVVSTCWRTHSKRPTDYNQKVCNWALSIQRKGEQHYRCFRIFKSVS